MRIFDTHAHYDSGAFNSDRMELLAELPNQDVELILNPGCDLASSRKAVELAEAFPHVYAAVGFHPSDPAAPGHLPHLGYAQTGEAFFF